MEESMRLIREVLAARNDPRLQQWLNDAETNFWVNERLAAWRTADEAGDINDAMGFAREILEIWESTELRDWLATTEASLARQQAEASIEQQRQAILAEMLRHSKTIADAVSRGRQPPFRVLWDYYEFALQYEIAKGLAPDQNRCALTLSLVLGLQPRGGEVSLAQLREEPVASGAVTAIRSLISHLAENARDAAHLTGARTLPQITDAQIARRYYIRAEDIAARLRDLWRRDAVYLRGPEARAYIQDKRGIIFLQNYFWKWSQPVRDPLHPLELTGDHIDLWNGERPGSSFEDTLSKVEDAELVWFWEIRD
jgi:hypothetical protein